MDGTRVGSGMLGWDGERGLGGPRLSGLVPISVLVSVLILVPVAIPVLVPVSVRPRVRLGGLRVRVLPFHGAGVAHGGDADDDLAVLEQADGAVGLAHDHG